MGLAIALAAGAAFLSALAVVFQRVALESAPTANSLSPRLMTHALRKRGWLVGFALMIGNFVLQASALRFGQLDVVQPVLTCELIFLVAILVVIYRRPVGRREVLGIVAIVIGLAGFFAAASPAVGKERPDSLGWTLVSITTVTGSVILVAAGRAGPRWWRAAALGAASAVLFAYNAAVTKDLTSVLRDSGWAHIFVTPDPYLLAVSGAAGLFMLQGGLHAGPITASRTANVVANPLVSIAIGVTAFSEELRSGVLFVTLDVLAIAVMCLGVAMLARSPLITGAGGVSGNEYLARTVPKVQAIVPEPAAAGPLPVATEDPAPLAP